MHLISDLIIKCFKMYVCPTIFIADHATASRFLSFTLDLVIAFNVSSVMSATGEIGKE